MKRLTWLVVFLMSAAVGWAQDVPDAVNYQGKLYDPAANGGAGGPMTGVQTVEFRIWDNPSGGALIWGRSFPVDCTADGTFNILLGDSGNWLGGATNVLRDTFEGENRYLELTVQGHGGAVSPRQQLVSAPYAMHAAHADAADSSMGSFQAGGGLSVLSGGATVAGNTTLNGNTAINGGTTVNGSLGVSGATTLSGGATIDNGLTVGAGATVNGNTTVNNGTLTVNNGAVTANQGLLVSSGASISGGATVSGGETINGNVDVNSGSLTVHNALLTANSGLTVSGQTKMMGAQITLSNPQTVTSDGFVTFLNNQDINVTVAGVNYHINDAGCLTLPAHAGDVISWTDCDNGAVFAPFSR